MTAQGSLRLSKAILAQADKLFFPPACLACNAPTEAASELLCADCRAKLRPIARNYCPKCGAPLDNYRCGPCSETKFEFDIARAAYVFDGPARDLLHRFKYDDFRACAGFFSRALLQLPSAVRWKGHFDLVMAVPLHHVRKRDRGFNQSELLARKLAAGLGIPYSRPVYRRYNTPSQTNLSREARTQNLDGAFALRRGADIAGKRVILVDDVFTTGSTANEISRLLKANGAARIAVVTATRVV